MGRAEQESTARIRRETLMGLLDTMAPTELQPITARVRISDIQAEAARQDEVTKIIDASKILEALNAVEESKDAKVARLAAELEQLDAAASTPSQPKRASKAPFSHIAALLPRTPVPVRTRGRAKTNNDAGLPRAEQKAVQLIADVRDKLEAAARLDSQGERLSFPTLSPRVAAELSGEEIAMLPMEVRLLLPEVSFPRVAMTPRPGADMCIAIHSTPCKELGHAIRVSGRRMRSRRRGRC